MPTLGINNEYITDFVATDRPSMTVGLAIHDDEPVIFIGFKPDKEIDMLDVCLGVVYVPIPGQSNMQLHFIVDDFSYYYCILDPGVERLRKILSKIEDLNILLMLIQPSNTGSSALLDSTSEIHIQLKENLTHILDCTSDNDITRVEHSAEGFLGKIGTQLTVTCLTDEYDFSENMIVIDG